MDLLSLKGTSKSAAGFRTRKGPRPAGYSFESTFLLGATVRNFSIRLFVCAFVAAGLLSGCSAESEPGEQPSSVSAPSQPEETSPSEPSPAESSPALEPCDLWEGPGDYLVSCAITAESFSDFDQISFKGVEQKETFDRRVADWVTNTSLIYTATFRCSPEPVEIVVNSEFTEEQAEAQALRFARIMGQMPIASRPQVREIWIHAGDEPAGGGNNSVLVHTEYADAIGTWIEEVFLHEAAHTSLDYAHGGSVNEARWAEAATEDGQFISQYAADYPDREDIAESHVAFIIRELSRENDRLLEPAAKIESLIPARLAYFESLGADFGPLSPTCG